MANLTLRDRLRLFWSAVTPTVATPTYNPRAEPFSNIQHLDVDRVRYILEGSQSGDTRNLFALYRDLLLGDSHLQAEFHKRKVAVLGDTISTKPFDKSNPDDVAASAAVLEMIQSCPKFLRACSHLLDSVLWPCALAEKVFAPAPPGSSLRYVLGELRPVPHQLMNFNYGDLRLWDVDPMSGFIGGTTQKLDPNRYIVHRGHLLTTPDFWGGPMRSIVYWCLFTAMNVGWWARFLDRFGSPFLVGKYDQSDDASRKILERAFSWATRIGGLVVSRDTDVQIQTALGQTDGTAYKMFLEVCNKEKSKLVVGQTLSSEAQPTGLGSGVAKEHGDVRDDLRQLDAKLLAETLHDQLFVQFLEINGLSGRVKILFGSETEKNLALMGDALKSLAGAGLQPADSALETIGEKFGFEVQRAAGGIPSALPLTALTAQGALPANVRMAAAANEEIAKAGAAALSQAFRGALAPVRRIILESRSADECQQRIQEFYADWKPDRLAPLLEEALVAHAANGAALHGDRG